MDLHIFSRQDALKHEPTKPTYAIRIFSSWEKPEDRKPLKDSSLYVVNTEYVFDDNDTQPFLVNVGPVWFDEEMAKKMLIDFRPYRTTYPNLEALMVHCSKGENRSPAVALALNEIFGLGQDERALFKQYPHKNHHTYSLLIDAARDLGVYR